MDCSTPGFPVHHQLPELTQTHVNRVGDATQLSPPVMPFSSHLQSFPASRSFQMSQGSWRRGTRSDKSILESWYLDIGDGGVERRALIFSCKNSKITIHCWTTIDRRILDPTNKRYPLPRAKYKPQQDGRRGEILFRVKPHTRQRCLEGSNKPCAPPAPRDPTETETELWVSPAEVWVSSGLLHGQGLWVQ